MLCDLPNITQEIFTEATQKQLNLLTLAIFLAFSLCVFGVLQRTVYDSSSLSVLAGLCQPDLSWSHLRGGKLIGENASIRYECRQACQEFS